MHDQIEEQEIKNNSKRGKSKMPAKLFYIFTVYLKWSYLVLGASSLGCRN